MMMPGDYFRDYPGLHPLLSPGIIIMEQNRGGQWVPAIPVPLYGGLRKRCQCGRRFWTEDGYRGHYALAHVLRLLPGDGYPVEWERAAEVPPAARHRR